MKKLVYLLLVTFSFPLWAQTNYVVTTPNSTTPGNYNILIGSYAGVSSTSLSQDNTFVGYMAGRFNTGYENTFIGSGAGLRNTTGNLNTFIGAGNGINTNSGALNTFLGAEAGASNTTGYRNMFVGAWTGFWSTTGNENAFLGTYTGYNNLTGSSNTFVGNSAGYNNTSGNANTFIGRNTGTFNTTGSNNIFVGYNTGSNNKTGSANTYLGTGAGLNNQDGQKNVIIGDSAGYENLVSNNMFVGSKAGYSNKNGQKNTLLGYQAGYYSVADSNTFIGYQAGYQTTSGKGNTFLGVNAGGSISEGSHNTIIGTKAGPSSIDSDDNVYLGFNSGAHDSGSGNTLLGTGSDAIAQHLTNATAIGAGATVAVSDAVILGNQASVGIGTSAPTARLEVNSGTDNESGVRLSRLTANSPIQLVSADKLLTVDETGKIVLTSAGHYSVRSVADWSDKVFMAGYKLRPLGEVENYIQTHQHLPGVPSAVEVVEQGINAARMDAKLLEKIEELTLYSIQLEKRLAEKERIHQQELQTIKQKQAQLERQLRELLSRK